MDLGPVQVYNARTRSSSGRIVHLMVALSTRDACGSGPSQESHNLYAIPESADSTPILDSHCLLVVEDLAGQFARLGALKLSSTAGPSAVTHNKPQAHLNLEGLTPRSCFEGSIDLGSRICAAVPLSFLKHCAFAFQAVKTEAGSQAKTPNPNLATPAQRLLPTR